MMKKYFPIRRSFVLILLGLILGGAAWAKVSSERAQAIPPGHQQLTLKVGSLERSYLLYIPPKYDKAKPLPLLIMLHGMGGTALLSAHPGYGCRWGENGRGKKMHQARNKKLFWPSVSSVNGC
jgi:poly(3-hydroxybutyrate) depolymerase